MMRFDEKTVYANRATLSLLTFQRFTKKKGLL